MKALSKSVASHVTPCVDLAPGGDLWRHAPVRDALGRPVCDLMMLVPGLRADACSVTLVSQQLHIVLREFGDRVLFAELNLRLGVLWVSVKGEAGLSAEVIEAVRARIAGSRVVGHYATRAARKLPWRVRVKRLLLGRLDQPRL